MSILDQAAAGAAGYIFGYVRDPYNHGYEMYRADNGGRFEMQLMQMAAMLDVNACTEKVYPNKSMNIKLEAAKKWLAENKS
jgi:hypothetical protein